MIVSIAGREARPASEAGFAVKVVHNIRITEEARDWLLRHYMDPDVDDPSQLLFIPTLHHTLATWHNGKKIQGPAYGLVKGEPRRLRYEVVSPFDNGRKFFAIGLDEPYDASARYLIEYFDRVWYVLKE
jgi:hypothetical protein